jgi:formylglycine-generating enzyme required for sulfatase activity
MGRSASGTDAYDDGRSIEQPEHEVTVAGFALDKYEVTASRFAHFVLAYDSWRAAGNPVDGAGASPNLAGSGWKASADTPYLAVDSKSLRAAIDDCTVSGDAGDSATELNGYGLRNCVDWREARAFCAWDGGWLPIEAEWEFAAAGGDENRLYPWGAAEPDVYSNALFGRVAR